MTSRVVLLDRRERPLQGREGIGTRVFKETLTSLEGTGVSGRPWTFWRDGGHMGRFCRKTEFATTYWGEDCFLWTAGADGGKKNRRDGGGMTAWYSRRKHCSKDRKDQRSHTNLKVQRSYKNIPSSANQDWKKGSRKTWEKTPSDLGVHDFLTQL